MPGEPLGQVHDYRAESTPGHLVGRQHRNGGIDQVLLVVPLRSQDGPGGPADPDHVGGSGALRGEAIEGPKREVPQLLVGGHERHLGAGCPATSANTPALAARARRSPAATTGVDTGRRPSPARRADPSSSAIR